MKATAIAKDLTVARRVATLPCEMSMSENYRQSETCVLIDDTSLGVLATRLRFVEICTKCFVN